MKNEIDKLREMLTEAGIPYHDIIEPMDFPFTDNDSMKRIMARYGDAGQYRRNQVIYGWDNPNNSKWKFDALWQFGSFGAKEGLIETYGPLGSTKSGLPRTMTADEAFEIIKADFEKMEKTK